MSALIVANAILVGVEVQWQSSNIGQSLPLSFNVLQLVCAVVFILELLLRLKAFGFLNMYWRKGVGWDHFDAVVVASILVEMIMEILGMILESDGQTGNASKPLTQLRIMRTLRVTKLIRTLRVHRVVRFIAPLRTLVFSITATLKSLFWSMVLLVMMMYVVGTMITQSVVESLAEGLDADLEKQVCKFWCSLDESIITLFESIAGGVNWREPMEPLDKLSFILPWIFAVYISVVCFAVLNVVTAVFCTRALETTQRNPELVATSLMQTRNAYIENLSAFFAAIDKAGRGTISLEDFERAVNDDELKAHLYTLELDTSDAWTLFKLIDTDKSGLITKEEFITGCEYLKGGARGVELAKMSLENRHLAKKLVNFMTVAEERLAALANPVPTVAPRPPRRRTRGSSGSVGQL